MKNTYNKGFKYVIITKFDDHLNESKFRKYNFKMLEKKSGFNFPSLINQIKI